MDKETKDEWREQHPPWDRRPALTGHGYCRLNGFPIGVTCPLPKRVLTLEPHKPVDRAFWRSVSVTGAPASIP